MPQNNGIGFGGTLYARLERDSVLVVLLDMDLFRNPMSYRCLSESVSVLVSLDGIDWYASTVA